MFENMAWLNEPPKWSVEGSRLDVVTGNHTDFWRGTFYGFVRDDGHFLYTFATGDFTASVAIDAHYEVLYDQCGMMVRAHERAWLKTGVEYTDGEQYLSTVVTRGFSDWSIASPTSSEGPLELRVTRHGDALRAQYSRDGGEWCMLRLAYLDMPQTVAVGVMCCSPERSGFRASFSDFVLGPPIPRALHD